jgi:hypothetical protein
MAITSKEFFFWQKVYAQNIVKPPVKTDVLEIPELPVNNSQIETTNCQKNLPWSIRDTKTSQCICENGLIADTWVCRKILCPNGYVEKNGIQQNECLQAWWSLGISCDATQLKNGTCHRNINQTLGIRSSSTEPNPTVVLQDIILGATSFVGTMMVIALIVMGIKYIKWWFDEGSTGDLKNNIRKLIIWLLLVIGSYTVIRVIQYVARGY